MDNKRIDEVISKVSNFGVDCGLSSEISVLLWTTLINLSIEHEFKEIDKLKEKA